MSELNYGGQAVIEGVMMRGERQSAVCVRDPGGEIIVHCEHLPAAVYRSRVLKLPFLRGLVVLWDSLGLGLRALTWSADISLSEDEDVSFSGPLAWGTIIVSLGLGVGLFFLLPMFLASLFDQRIESALLSNLAEGGIRLSLFTLYLWGIGFMPDIRRVFGYHGAEHKTINAYEHGARLEPSTVAGYPKAHIRCGTGFLLIVLIIFVLVSTVIGRPSLVVRLLSRVILIPVVSGISYELTKLAARHYESSAIVRAMTWPGLALQRLTTREPDLAMIEVGIQALKAVLRSEGMLIEENAVPDGTVTGDTTRDDGDTMANGID